MKTKKIDTVVFDFDGTLINSLDDLTDNVNLALKEEGYPERTTDEVRQFVGNGIRPLIDRAVPKGTDGARVESCYETFKAYYLENMEIKTKPYDGILELLRELKTRKIKTAVVSNKLDVATKKMCSHYFGDLINEAIGENEKRNKKPEPDNVIEALRRLGSQKENTIYVGDTKVDVETAKNSGLPILGAAWGYRGIKELKDAGADYIIEKPMEVLNFL